MKNTGHQGAVVPAPVRRSVGILTGDLLTGWVLAVSAGSMLVSDGAPVGTVVALLGLIAGLVLLVSRFPRSADPEDAREAVYRSDGLGRRLGFADGFGGLGRLLALRMLACGDVALLLFDPTGEPGRAGELVLAVLSVAGLLLTVAVEPFVVRLLRLPAPYAVRLPGLPAIPRRTGRAWLVAPAGLLATGLAGVAAALSAPGWVLLLIATAGAVPLGALVLQVRNRRRIAGQVRRGLADSVQNLQPQFVLYTARPDDASYQLTMWLPYLERAGRPFLIVTRGELPAEIIADRTDVPVLCCRSVADLDLIMAPTLRAAFYVNASSGNGALIRYHRLTHVYLGHGDSDKPPSYNPTHAMYDRIFTAGPAAGRRYGDHGVRIDPGKFRIVGRPQVETVLPVTPERTAERLAGGPPVILYAPTWRGHVSETALSSLDRAERIVTALADRGIEVIFRPHPFSYEDEADAATIERVKSILAGDAERHGRRHRYGLAAENDLDAFGCMNAADAMITDVSSLVSDFLFSGKPLAMVAPIDSDPDTLVADYPVARATYLIDHDLARLPAVLEELLRPTDDRMAAVRAEVRNDYLGDLPVDGYADEFVRAVQEVCDAPPSAVADVAESEDGSVGVSRDTVRRNLDSLGRTMISGVAAVVALGAAIGGNLLLGLISVTVFALVLGLTMPRRRTAETREPSLDGPRMIMALAAGAVLAGAAEDPGPVAVLAALAMLLLIIAIAAEPMITTASDHPGVIAVGLPEFAAPPGGAWPTLLPMISGVVGVAGWGLLAGWVLLNGVLSAALWLLITSAVLVMAWLAVRAARARLLAAASGEAEVSTVLEQRAPEFCVYFGSGIGARYQIGMWLPYFRRIGRPFLIVTRSLPMLEEIRDLVAETDVPVLHRPTLRSLEDIVVPSLKVAFYVNNAVRNTHLIERRELTHVWLNHGDSEKPACYNPVHAMYDRIFAAGQAAVDRYARHEVIIPAAKFRIVGRPQVDAIVLARHPIGLIDQPTVLYAPTWQGPYADSRVYSLPTGAQIVGALLERGVRVIFRAHPFNYRFAGAKAMVTEIGALLAADRERTGRAHLWGAEAEQERSVEDCFNESDAMIADVSAVISDFLASAKPFAVVSVGRTADQLRAEAPAAAAGYPIAEDLSDLQKALDGLLVDDPLAGERERMRRYYLGDLVGSRAADGFLGAAHELLSTKVPA
jgi:CDP-glycerol glycerophosphotransferase (TagB/SpsB family)